MVSTSTDTAPNHIISWGRGGERGGRWGNNDTSGRRHQRPGDESMGEERSSHVAKRCWPLFLTGGTLLWWWAQHPQRRPPADFSISSDPTVLPFVKKWKRKRYLGEKVPSQGFVVVDLTSVAAFTLPHAENNRLSHAHRIVKDGCQHGDLPTFSLAICLSPDASGTGRPTSQMHSRVSESASQWNAIFEEGADPVKCALRCQRLCETEGGAKCAVVVVAIWVTFSNLE